MKKSARRAVSHFGGWRRRRDQTAPKPASKRAAARRGSRYTPGEALSFYPSFGSGLGVMEFFNSLLEGSQGEVLCGVANLGFRPTVDGAPAERPLLEVHLFRFRSRYLRVRDRGGVYGAHSG